MRKLIARVSELLLVLLLVSFGVFALMSNNKDRAAVTALGGEQPKEVYAQWLQDNGFNDPLLTRYWDWITGVFSGDLGTSLTPPNTAVWERITGALPVSIQLAGMALVLALLIAVPLAMYAASHAGGVVDRVIGALNFGMLSMPSLLTGLLLVMVFVNQLHWFPRVGWVRFTEDPMGNLHHAALPVLTIALMEAAYFTRVLRNDLAVTLQEDFVLAAKARGMSTWRILFVDALRPSSFSLVTLLGLSLGTLIGSTVIVETIFNLPGMGRMLSEAVNGGDFPIVQGTVLLIAVIYVVANALIDVIYELLDPRTRRATS